MAEKEFQALMEQRKQQVSEYNHSYYEKNKEKLREYQRQYRKTHREELNRKQREWAKAHPDTIAKINKRYYDKKVQSLQDSATIE